MSRFTITRHRDAMAASASRFTEPSPPFSLLCVCVCVCVCVYALRTLALSNSSFSLDMLPWTYCIRMSSPVVFLTITQSQAQCTLLPSLQRNIFYRISCQRSCASTHDARKMNQTHDFNNSSTFKTEISMRSSNPSRFIQTSF